MSEGERLSVLAIAHASGDEVAILPGKGPVKATLKHSLARAANSGAASVLLSGWELASHGLSNRLPVLTYHRVDLPDSRPDLDPAMVSATPRDFEQQIGGGLWYDY